MSTPLPDDADQWDFALQKAEAAILARGEKG